jgi:hypothetical protein
VNDHEAGVACASPLGAPARQTASTAASVSGRRAAGVPGERRYGAVLATKADHSAGIEHAAEGVDGLLV